MTLPLPIAPSVDIAFRFSAVSILLAAANFSALPPRLRPLAIAVAVMAAALYLLTTTAVTGFQRQNRERRQGLAEQLGYLDCLLVGLALLLVPFSPVTLLVVAMLVAVRATATGGISRLSAHLCLTMLGALIGFAALQPAFRHQSLESVNILSLIVASLFLIFVAWRMYQRQDTLTTTAKQLNVDNIQLKLNNYKLAKYLSPSLRRAIISGKRVALETQRKRVTVFFSDIRGFSELSEGLEADTLTSMLNLYLTEMSDIALKFGGTVDKFIGDAIMVFFGDPVTGGAREDCIACVSMAIAMQKRMQDLNKRWACQGIRKPLNIRMGINTGFCTVGNFGTENRMDYTLLGTEVNKASRLESAADAGEILVSRQTYELIKDTILCEPRGGVRLKGFKEPVETFSVVDLRANLGRDDCGCVEHSTDGFTMFMDLDNIPHLQKHRILASLEGAREQLQKDIEFSTRDDIKIFK